MLQAALMALINLLAGIAIMALLIAFAVALALSPIGAWIMGAL